MRDRSLVPTEIPLERQRGGAQSHRDDLVQPPRERLPFSERLVDGDLVVDRGRELRQADQDAARPYQ